MRETYSKRIVSRWNEGEYLENYVIRELCECELHIPFVHTFPVSANGSVAFTLSLSNEYGLICI